MTTLNLNAETPFFRYIHPQQMKGNYGGPYEIKGDKYFDPGGLDIGPGFYARLSRGDNYRSHGPLLVQGTIGDIYNAGGIVYGDYKAAVSDSVFCATLAPIPVKLIEGSRHAADLGALLNSAYPSHPSLFVFDDMLYSDSGGRYFKVVVPGGMDREVLKFRIYGTTLSVLYAEDTTIKEQAILAVLMEHEELDSIRDKNKEKKLDEFISGLLK
jgi:hypothetical protein